MSEAPLTGIQSVAAQQAEEVAAAPAPTSAEVAVADAPSQADGEDSDSGSESDSDEQEGGAWNPFSDPFDNLIKAAEKLGPEKAAAYIATIRELKVMSVDPATIETNATEKIAMLVEQGKALRSVASAPPMNPADKAAAAAAAAGSDGAVVPQPGAAPAATLLTNTDGSVRVPAPAATLLTNTDGSVRAAGSMGGSSRKTRHRTPKRRRSAKSKGRKKLSKKKTGSRK